MITMIALGEAIPHTLHSIAALPRPSVNESFFENSLYVAQCLAARESYHGADGYPRGFNAKISSRKGVHHVLK